PFVAVDDVGHLGSAHQPRWCRWRRAGDPAVVVDGAIAEHLEILRVALRRRVRVRSVEGVAHAHAFDWLLRDTVDHHRSGNAGDLKKGPDNIDHVMELGADSARVLDVPRPSDSHTLSRPPEMGGHLLGPFERGVERPGPSD